MSARGERHRRSGVWGDDRGRITNGVALVLLGVALAATGVLVPMYGDSLTPATVRASGSPLYELFVALGGVFALLGVVHLADRLLGIRGG